MEFTNEKFRPKKDQYSKSRGGTSKFLFVACGNCENPLMIYQKDGPGRLMRMYADRIVWPPSLVEDQKNFTTNTIRQVGTIACLNCHLAIAHPMVYSPENRPAYRVIPGTLHAYGSTAQAKSRFQAREG